MDKSQIAALSLAEKAAIFIRAYEGYLEKAKWDVNAFRLGHGSDTITLSNGTYRKVVEGDKTTRENALKDLMRRIREEFIPRLRSQLGETTFNKLPYPALVGLLSLSYNYGSITKQSIINAARTLDTDLLADTVINATYNDNKSQPESVRQALRKRRAEEAAFIRTVPATGDSGSDSGLIIPLLALAAAAGLYAMRGNMRKAA